MIRRMRYALLFCMVLCVLYCFPALADNWDVWVPDVEEDFPADAVSYQFNTSAVVPADDDPIEEWEDDSAAEIPVIDDRGGATPSNARRLATVSNSTTNISIQPMAGYSSPYDGAISATIVGYFTDLLPKLGNVDYVLFRTGQYTYRMVYADDMGQDGTKFYADNATYVLYDSRYYSWTTGYEGSFSLDADLYLVYSNVGHYPLLGSNTVYTLGLLLLGVVILLFTIYRSFFAPGRMRI